MGQSKKVTKRRMALRMDNKELRFGLNALQSKQNEVQDVFSFVFQFSSVQFNFISHYSSHIIQN